MSLTKRKLKVAAKSGKRSSPKREVRKRIKPVILKSPRRSISANKARKPGTRRAHKKPILPMNKIHKILETCFPGGTVEPEATAYLAGVLQYVAAEILELSGNKARYLAKGRKTKITEFHIEEIMGHDLELNRLFTGYLSRNEEEAEIDKSTEEKKYIIPIIGRYLNI